MNRSSIPVSLPRYAGTGYGSAMVGVPASDVVLFTFFEGKAASRLAELDCRTGKLRIVRGVSGMLMDGVVGPLNCVYLLTEFALHEYDLVRHEVSRTLRVSKEMTRVQLLPPGHLAISRDWSNVTIIIDLEAWSVTERFGFPTDLLLLSSGSMLACSFQNGFAKRVDSSFRPDRQKIPLPFARYLISANGYLFGVKGAPTPGDVREPDRATKLIRLNVETLQIEAEREIRGIQEVFGLDAEGCVIVGSASGLILADANTLEVSARQNVNNRITAAARVGHCAVAFASHPQFVTGIEVCRWGSAA